MPCLSLNSSVVSSIQTQLSARFGRYSEVTGSRSISVSHTILPNQMPVRVAP